ncbi:porin [Algoriphagus hitonicola]|uniref:Putative beta-barrel porin-2, OmpL-like. bbp2 n=1 Tax=Algoriphagus hitonicola TaxID=435880 RepID=A0A1I2SA62_9BACT|nr:porin [Algoriphagus hitonicola]SFG46946.1 Putative beta-barrel porin-2, OmpL-like. bbp2 [Algoriphagus hitonicola]
MRKVLCIFIVFWAAQSFGQEKEKTLELDFSGFLDLYYGHDFVDPMGIERRLPFLYNHTKQNRLGVNLALFTMSVKSDFFRANLGIHQGTYVRDNYANEPELFKWIHQANVGVAIDREKRLWLDAGVLPSHIGFESAVSIENPSLSRSIIAENSPYFETGVRLSWQMDERWYLAFFYLNGWQRIRAIPGRNRPSFGTQATFSPSENTRINWSTFLGTDQPLEAETMIYFTNFIGDFRFEKGWRLVARLDGGRRTLPFDFDRNWWGMSAILQKRFSEKFASAFRVEHYNDPFQAISISLVDQGIKTSGLSLNADWKLFEAATFRLEGRWLTGPELGTGGGNSENYFLLGSLAFAID